MTYATRILSALARIGMVCALVGIGASTLSAANKYVRQGGAGAMTGNDWNNALPYLLTASPINDGDTVWVAGGGYGGWQVAKNGVTVKRARATDAACTGAAGWNAAFDSQVQFSVNYSGGGPAAIRISSGSSDAQVHNVTIGNQIPGEFLFTLPAPTGIDVNTTTADQVFGVLAIGSSNAVQYCDFVGPNSISADCGVAVNNKATGPYLSTFRVSHCTFSKLGAGMFLGQCNEITVEYCTVSEIYGNGKNHPNCLYVYSSSGGVFRYNVLHNWEAMGLYLCSNDAIDNWKVYGNVFYDGGQAIDLDPSGGVGSVYGPNWLFYNNTFVNCGVGIRGSGRYGASSTGGLARNNIFKNVGYDWGGLTHDDNFSDANLGEASGIFSANNPFVDATNYDFRLVSTTGAGWPRDAGEALDPEYNTDRDGNTRGADGSWDIGAYEVPGGAGSPGQVQFSTPAITVSEEDGTVTLTVTRTGGTTGAVSVNYTTADGTAAAGTEYTFAEGTETFSDGSATEQTFDITLADLNATGSKTFTVTLSGQTGGATLGLSTCTITITGTGTEAPCLLSGVMQAENACSILSPFVLGTNSGTIYVYQPNQATDTNTTGRAVFTFTNSAGDYYIEATVNAPHGGANSFYISTNGANADVWDIVAYTIGFEARNVGLRGNGTFDAPQYTNQIFTFAAGTKTIVFWGREGNCQLDSVRFVPVVTTPPPTIRNISTTATNVSPDAAAYRRSGQTVTITVEMSHPCTVTGNPTLSLSGGGEAAFTSGSGTTNLVWTYTVDDENTQRLDVTAINLNGGTIRYSGVDADLSVPTPGAAGSLSAGQVVIVDTIAPTITIGDPPTRVTRTTDVPFQLTYADANLGPAPSQLSTDNVTLDKTLTADCTLAFSGPSFQPTVTLTGPSGAGTLSFSLLAGTCVDKAGNEAGVAGPSAVVTVESFRLIILKTLTSTNAYFQ